MIWMECFQGNCYICWCELQRGKPFRVFPLGWQPTSWPMILNYAVIGVKNGFLSHISIVTKGTRLLPAGFDLSERTTYLLIHPITWSLFLHWSHDLRPSLNWIDPPQRHQWTLSFRFPANSIEHWDRSEKSTIANHAVNEIEVEE